MTASLATAEGLAVCDPFRPRYLGSLAPLTMSDIGPGWFVSAQAASTALVAGVPAAAAASESVDSEVCAMFMLDPSLHSPPWIVLASSPTSLSLSLWLSAAYVCRPPLLQS